jgi:hypothetical protein
MLAGCEKAWQSERIVVSSGSRDSDPNVTSENVNVFSNVMTQRKEDMYMRNSRAAMSILKMPIVRLAAALILIRM